MAPLTKVFRGRSNSSTPPRAVYSDLNSAHANITGRAQASQADWPLLSPGWAGDQPAAASNPFSTPISAKARTSTSRSVVDPPLAVRRPSRPPPVGTPEIPEAELGTKFPNVSPEETNVDPGRLLPEPSNDLVASRRRSRSVGFLGGFQWYEDDYGSGRQSQPIARQHRFPSAPQALDDSPFSSQSRPELPHFQFPQSWSNPFDDNVVVDSHASPRGVPAGSTISNILQSYGSNGQPYVSHSNFQDAGADNEDLSQTAWSPRPSNEVVAYQIHSTHGSIVDPHDEPRPSFEESSIHSADAGAHDAVQEVIEDIFSPQAGISGRAGPASAYAALVRPNGQTISREMSRPELERYERMVQSHVRDPSVPHIFDAGGYTHEGRLSLEYLPSSITTSSISIGEAIARDQGLPARSGTPPLLFGSNAIHRSAVSASDWETVEGASRHGTRGFAGTQANSSSIADYSSSSTGFRGLPAGGQVLSPQHPRYVHTWNMYRDHRTGETVMLADANSAHTGPPLASPVAGQNQYHHPSPLSEGHTNPFTSSPVSGIQGSNSEYSKDASDSAEDCDNGVLEISPSAQKPVRIEKGDSSGRDHSSAWVSTDEGQQEIGASYNAHHLTLAQACHVDHHGNVMGTPDGTGAREVGSSMANASSPGANFSSSPFVPESAGAHVRVPDPSKQLRRTVSQGSSGVSSLSSLSPTDSYRFQQSVESKSAGPGEYELTALPAFPHLPPEAHFHRKQLIENNLLPPDSPPFLRRHSLGLGYLKDYSPSKLAKATAATGANFSRHLQHFVPNMPSLSNVRKRSPHRSDADDIGILSDIEMQSTEPRRGRTHKNHRNKDHTKSKVSDSEGSVDSEVGLTSHHRQLAAQQYQDIDPSMSTSFEPVQMEGVQIHPTHAGFPQSQASNAQQTRSTGQSASSSSSNNSEFHVDRLFAQPSMRDILQAVRDPRPTPRLQMGNPRIQMGNRPIARAESPHLHRIPRPPTDRLKQRQKDLGRFTLFLICWASPVTLLYYLGYFDKVIEWCTDGEICEMRATEKKIALVLTVLQPVLLAILLVVLLLLL